jgi:SAM-dependent methyltransferase
VSELRIIGGRQSHDVLRRVLADCKPGRVLDCPAGTGVLSEFLRERGFAVHCGDIDPGNFQAMGFPFTRVNLNRSIPLPDASFDLIVCANGLHRLFCPGAAIAEFHRLLKPGGRLYLTINNYASLMKRLRFLFYGSITNTINEGSFRQTIDDPEANVRNVLCYPQLANLLTGAGFEIVARRAASVRPIDRVLAPLGWLIALGALLISPRSRRRNHLAITNGSAILPGGKYLFLEVAKRG